MEAKKLQQEVKSLSKEISELRASELTKLMLEKVQAILTEKLGLETSNQHIVKGKKNTEKIKNLELLFVIFNLARAK